MKCTRLIPLGILLVLAGCGHESAPDPQSSATDDARVSAPQVPGDPPQNPDMTRLAAAVDTNHDGRMSRAEWQAQGLPMTSFDGFEKGRGYVTLEDYRKNPAPPGIDLDGDGTLTIAEFREFDRKMSAQIAKGGPLPK